MVINILPDNIISQIAAGEVIERPSCVIKELVENSLDSGADKIEIEIENYGLKKIQVKDNGIGIIKEDLLLAPKRHATSKIKNFDDLYNITSFGFRGEALSSIFSVANTKILSKHKNSKIAFKIEDKNLEEIKECGHPQGTSVIVENLFEKTPARKKYLKSMNQELREIIDVIKRFEIINYNVSFILRHNSKLLVNKPKLKNMEENLIFVLDKNLKGNLFEINYKTKGIKITGFIANPSVITYSFRKNQFIFVNSRFVKSKLIRDAVYEGFSTNLMEGRHPFFVINIEIDPQIIDVNVHPKKIEIKFENELEIYEAVRLAIKEIFERQAIFKPFEVEKNKNLSLNETLKDFNLQISKKEKKYNIKNNEYFKKDYQKELFEETSNYINKNQKSFELNQKNNKDIKNKDVIDKINLHKGPLYEPLRNFRIIGQVHKTFIIVETPKEMLIVDQHVAEEKFNFERFVQNFHLKKPLKQTLLKPEIITLNLDEILLFKENKQLFEKLGFNIEEFGEKELLIRAVPKSIRGDLISSNYIKEILGEISIVGESKFIKELNENKLASMSCRASIKAGDELTISQMNDLIENLRYLKEPFNCPHGRPVLLRYSFYEIEKMFKRH